MDKQAADIDVKKRKRRAVLSCNDCRRRKLKCDRELPCNRCIKGDIAASCTYEDEEAPVIAASNPSQYEEQQLSKAPLTTPIFAEILNTPQQSTSKVVANDKVHQLERRVESLEAHILSLTARHREVQAQPSSANEQTRQPENTALTGFYKGHNYATFAYGPSSPITIVAHFPSLRPFMKSMYFGSSLARVQAEMRTLEEHARATKAFNPVMMVSNIRHLLPDRPTVDKLIQVYLDTFETTCRILHIPSFRRDYQTFWDDSTGSDREIEVTVLAILACVLCTSTHESTRYNPEGSTFRCRALTWVKVCEAWLRKQSNKHRTIATLQVRCLRLLALMTTCNKTKQFYQETQAHMGFMRAIGMHRDPSILGARCSVFEGEMRRRLWATSVELELQASIDRGTPSVLSAFEYDTRIPRNINDTELSADTQHLPSSQPLSVYTDSSFAHYSMCTAPLRIELCKTSNSIHGRADLQEVLKYEQQLQEALVTIPHWSDPRSLLARNHLDVHLRQFIVILHTPAVLQNQSTIGSSRYSILQCLEAATALIHRHAELIESQIFGLCCIRSDYYRAALIICHIAYYACNRSDNMIVSAVQCVFEDAIAKALRVLEERCTRPGRGSKQYWYVCSASSLVRVAFAPDRVEAMKRQVTDKVSKMLYRFLSLHDDHNEYYLADEIIFDDKASSPGAANYDHNVSSLSSQPVGTLTNNELRLDALDFGINSEWMDEFWLFNDLPTLPFGS